MKSECEGISQAIDLGNLGVIAPHKVKYFNHLGFVLMGIRDLFRQLMGHSWRPGEENKSF